MIDIGKTLREARTKVGLTGSQVGERIHMTQQNYSKWENNKSVPPVEMVDSLCDALVIIDRHTREELKIASLTHANTRKFTEKDIRIMLAHTVESEIDYIRYRKIEFMNRMLLYYLYLKNAAAS